MCLCLQSAVGESPLTVPAETLRCSANHSPALARGPRRLGSALKLGKTATWQPSERPHMATVTSAAVERRGLAVAAARYKHCAYVANLSKNSRAVCTLSSTYTAAMCVSWRWEGEGKEEEVAEAPTVPVILFKTQRAVHFYPRSN